MRTKVTKLYRIDYFSIYRITTWNSYTYCKDDFENSFLTMLFTFHGYFDWRKS